MRITVKEISKAMSLDADGVIAALRNADYKVDKSEITSVMFDYMNERSEFIYEISGDFDVSGHVLVSYVEDKNTKRLVLTACY